MIDGYVNVSSLSLSQNYTRNRLHLRIIVSVSTLTCFFFIFNFYEVSQQDGDSNLKTLKSSVDVLYHFSYYGGKTFILHGLRKVQIKFNQQSMRCFNHGVSKMLCANIDYEMGL